MEASIRFWNTDGSELLYEAKLLPTQQSSYSVYFENTLWNIYPTQDHAQGHTDLSHTIHDFIRYNRTENGTLRQELITPKFNNIFEYKGNYVRCIGFSIRPNQGGTIIGDVPNDTTHIIINEQGYDFYAQYNSRGFKRYFLMKNNDIEYYSFTDQPENFKLKYVTLSEFYGTSLQYRFITELDEDYNIEMYVLNKFTLPNKYIQGVSVKPNEAEIIPYTTIIYELYPDITKFYAVFQYVKEISDDYIELFRYNSEQSRVDKTNYLELALNEMGENIIPYQMRGACNIIRPTITIALKLGGQFNRTSIDFNYVYIPDLSRYYFVENYTYLTNNLVELNLRIDVLMTYRAGISQLYGFIDRNEFQYSPLIIDNKQVVMTGYTTKTTEVETEIFQPKHIADVGEGETIEIDLPAMLYTISGNGLSLKGSIISEE